MLLNLLNIFFFPVSAENVADNQNLTENLCLHLKRKHAGCPVIFFLDENDIITADNLSSKSFLKNLVDFHIISAFSPIVENLVRLKSSGFDFEEMEFYVTEENCMWVNLFLRYRNSRAIQNFCRNIGKSLREEVSLECKNKYYFYISSIMPIYKLIFFH